MMIRKVILKEYCMLYLGERRLIRNKHRYRVVSLPYATVRGWDQVDSVAAFYDEALDQVVIRPIRNDAVAQGKATPAREEINHTPQAHFSL
jgi:hypothetical protein